MTFIHFFLFRFQWVYKKAKRMNCRLFQSYIKWHKTFHELSNTALCLTNLKNSFIKEKRIPTTGMNLEKKNKISPQNFLHYVKFSAALDQRPASPTPLQSHHSQVHLFWPSEERGMHTPTFRIDLIVDYINDLNIYDNLHGGDVVSHTSYQPRLTRGIRSLCCIP